jgi:predicted nucleic acid-binding protein
MHCYADEPITITRRDKSVGVISPEEYERLRRVQAYLQMLRLSRELLAHRFDRSAHDAAYLTLAEAGGEPPITGDLRLYNAVRDQLDWMRWIGDGLHAG